MIPMINAPMTGKNRQLVTSWFGPSQIPELVATADPGDLIEIDRGGYQHWGVYAGLCDSPKGQPEAYTVHLGLGANLPSEDHRHVAKPMVCKSNIMEVVGQSSIRINNSDDKRGRIVEDINSLNARIEQFASKNEPYDFVDRNCENFSRFCRYVEQKDDGVTDQTSAFFVTMIFIFTNYIHSTGIHRMGYLEGLGRMGYIAVGAAVVIHLYFIIVDSVLPASVFRRFKFLGSLVVQACLAVMFCTVPVVGYMYLIFILGSDNATLVLKWLKVGTCLVGLISVSSYGMAVLTIAMSATVSVYGPPYTVYGVGLPGVVYVLGLSFTKSILDLKCEDDNLGLEFWLIFLGYVFSVPGLTYFVSLHDMTFVVTFLSKRYHRP